MKERTQRLLEIADDELILGWRNSEWTGIAPLLEEDVAFSSIAQNEIGHARAVYELLADDADALAFDRKPEEYRCSPLVELRLLDWAHTIARRYLYEQSDRARIERLMESDDPAVSGWGFELTMRLPRGEGDDQPPTYAINFLFNLGRYVRRSGNPLGSGHVMDLNGPICIGADTALHAVNLAELLGRLAHLHDFAAPPNAAAVELEDPEVTAGHVDGDVVDRDVADAALERAGVGVSVQDEVGAVLGDRGRHPVAAEIGVDTRRLALERVHDRRVVEEDDP